MKNVVVVLLLATWLSTPSNVSTQLVCMPAVTWETHMGPFWQNVTVSLETHNAPS